MYLYGAFDSGSSVEIEFDSVLGTMICGISLGSPIGIGAFVKLSVVYVTPEATVPVCLE